MVYTPSPTIIHHICTKSTTYSSLCDVFNSCCCSQQSLNSSLSSNRPLSPSWSESEGSSSDHEDGSSKRNYSTAAGHSRRGPGGRGGGGNNVAGVKGPRWNEERKQLVLTKFLQPFVTRELYRLDLQAALENFIVEEGWDDAPMKDQVIRIKRLLTNARDINKKKAARSGTATGAVTAKSNAMAQQKKKDSAAKAASKSKAIAAVKAKKSSKATTSSVSSTAPVTPPVIAPVVTIPATVVVKAPVPPVDIRASVSKPKTPKTGVPVTPSPDASPFATLVAAATSKAFTGGMAMVPPPISIPWSPQSSVSSHGSDVSDVDETADGDMPPHHHQVAANPLSVFMESSAPCTPLPSSIGLSTPLATPHGSHGRMMPSFPLEASSSSDSDDNDSVGSGAYHDDDSSFASYVPLPMLPSLPSLLHQQAPTPRVQVPVLTSADVTSIKIEVEDVDAVDAAPLVDAANGILTYNPLSSNGYVLVPSLATPSF